LESASASTSAAFSGEDESCADKPASTAASSISTIVTPATATVPDVLPDALLLNALLDSSGPSAELLFFRF
jgi:hypothetical protein